MMNLNLHGSRCGKCALRERVTSPQAATFSFFEILYKNVEMEVIKRATTDVEADIDAARRSK
jgi:hypothetical protein